jgi:hypothetical protein
MIEDIQATQSANRCRPEMYALERRDLAEVSVSSPSDVSIRRRTAPTHSLGPRVSQMLAHYGLQASPQ